MNRYCLKLNLPVEFVPVQIDTSNGFIFEYDRSYISQEYKDFLLNLGIEIGFAEVFYKNPEFEGGIHIDGRKENTDFVKINYVYGIGNSSMNWYKLKPNKQLTLKETILPGMRYLQASAEDCVQVYSDTMENCSLVNVGELHGIKNVTEPRFCYSLVLYDKNKNQITWDTALELLKGYY